MLHCVAGLHNTDVSKECVVFDTLFSCNTVTRLSVAYTHMVEKGWLDICTDYWLNETPGQNRSTRRITNQSDTLSKTFLTWTDRDETQASVVKGR